MSIIDSILNILVPHACLGCGVEPSLICAGCLESLAPEILVPSSLKVRSATLYEGLAKSLIWRLKSDGVQAAAKVMARQMITLLNDEDHNYLIVPVPTATSRVRQRGYDQAKLLARALSRQTGLAYSDCLARHGQAHQVGSSRSKRLSQLSSAFRVKKAIGGERILLIDDVTTTGATLETAAAFLKMAGARRVEAITFAYKPKHT